MGSRSRSRSSSVDEMGRVKKRPARKAGPYSARYWDFRITGDVWQGGAETAREHVRLGAAGAAAGAGTKGPAGAGAAATAGATAGAAAGAGAGAADEIEIEERIARRTAEPMAVGMTCIAASEKFTSVCLTLPCPKCLHLFF